MKFELQLQTGIYTTRDGLVRRLEHPFGPIHIIDQVFEPLFISGLHAVLGKIPFVANDYDTDASKHVLHLKCELPAIALMSEDITNEELLALLPQKKGASHLSAITRITAQALEKFYPEYTEISLGRVHVNCLPYGDLLSVHEDGWPGASLTGLYFANSQWLPGWHGELIMCDPMGESMYAIEPRPGRLVLFPGEIPHRAGSSSRACYAHRLTIGHKFRAKKLTDAQE